MKKGKFWKALLALGLVVVSAASVFGMAACDNGGGGGSGTGGGGGGGDDDFDMDSVVVADPIVPQYAGPAAALEAGLDEVTYSVNGADLPLGNLQGVWTNGAFSISSGAEVRDRNTPRTYDGKQYQYSLKFGDGTLTLNAPAAGKFKVLVENGSSGATSAAILFNGVSYPYPKSGIQAVEIDVEKAGVYTITRNNSVNSTTDIFYAEFVTKLDNTPIEKIEVVSTGKSDYLLTQGLDCTGIKVNAIHMETGKISEVNLSNVQFNTSNYNAKASGTYTINLSYTLQGNLGSVINTFNASYEVKVYTVSEIKLDTTLTKDEKQTTLKQVYLPNEGFDGDQTGLTVTATGTLGSDSVQFTMNPADYVVSVPDLTTEGKKQVDVSVSKAYANGATVKASYDIIVKAKKTPVNNEIVVTVGGTTGDFETVTQALGYLKACGYTDKANTDVIKTINIADGAYYEKISIDIPNVHLIGSATKTPNATTDNGVVLWYDAANGLLDPAGTPYGTKGSSSVTVMSTANGFVAENITFKNYYNTIELYNELKGKTGGTQAVALMVESSDTIFRNCKMTGYQDTLYANKGYQFYDNCWIEGRTDYIFGQNAIPYFYQCTIYTVSAGASDGNGGYIVAYQNTSNEYGPVFNGCTITGAAEGATNISLGRAWGAEFTMVTLNCKISDNYSKKPHTAGIKSGERYVYMQADPKPANMLEYENFGLDGTTPDLTEAEKTALAGTCTFMSKTQADKYQIENVATLLKFNPIKA